MTQPPGRPPQGGYGAQPPQGGYGTPQPPYPGPYGQQPQQPPQAPGTPPNPYSAPVPQQPYGAGQQPYGAGAPPYGTAPYGGYPPPPQPPGDSRNKLVLIVVGAILAVALVSGGIFLIGASEDSKEAADKRVSGERSPSAERDGPAADDKPSADDSGDVGGSGDPDGSDDDTDPGSGSGKAPAAPAVEGQWQDAAARTLTVGTKYTSGDLKDKYALSYIDTTGKGILTGLGTYRDDASFRIALQPMGDEGKDDADLTYGTVRRDGDDVVITWDGGGTDTLAYIGALDE